MANIPNPGDRLWRTDLRGLGRGVYALLSNDVEHPSPEDPLVGVMETTEMAEDVVNTHNGALAMYGRRYRRVMHQAEQTPRAIAMHTRRHRRVTEEEDLSFSFSLRDEERQGLFAIVEWLRDGFAKQWLKEGPTQRAVDKLYQALGDKND